MVGFVVLSSLANIALGYVLAVYLQRQGVAPFRSVRWRGLWPRGRRSGRDTTSSPLSEEPLSPAFSGGSPGGQMPAATPPAGMPPAGMPPAMPLISPFAAPPAADPVDETLAVTAELSALAATAATASEAQLAEALPSVEPVASGPDGLTPEATAQESVAESQVLAGIEAFRAQLAEMKQQSVAAAE